MSTTRDTPQPLRVADSPVPRYGVAERARSRVPSIAPHRRTVSEAHADTRPRRLLPHRRAAVARPPVTVRSVQRFATFCKLGPIHPASKTSR